MPLFYESLKHPGVTYLIILVWGFLEPFLKLSALLVLARFFNRLCSGHLNLGMKLVSSTLCIIAVVNACVGIIVQLTGLRERKTPIRSKNWNTMSVKFETKMQCVRICIKGCLTNRVVVEACAVVIVQTSSLIKDKPSLCHSLFSSGPQHISYGSSITLLKDTMPFIFLISD